MDHEWLFLTIRKLFVISQVFALGWCLACLILLAVFKFIHTDKTFPEIVAIGYGGIAIVIFWLIYVVRI